MSVYQVRIGDTFVNVDGPVVTLSGSLRWNISEGDGEFLSQIPGAVNDALSAAMAADGTGGPQASAEEAGPCEGFAWIGQSFACCDECGFPYWEHTHERRAGGGPFHESSLVLIADERKVACRKKWGGS